MIDVNVHYGNWPFQDLGFKSIDMLQKHLSENGITKALIYSADAIFAEDHSIPDAKLAAELKNNGSFIHVPAVNPLYKNWMKIVSSSKSDAVIVYPNFHKYELLSAENCEMAEYLSGHNITQIISLRIEDERAQHPSCLIPRIKIENLIEFAKKFPELRILCLNAYYGEIEALLKSTLNISVDIAFAEKFNTLEKLTGVMPADRILFGSHTPFFYTAANICKLKYADISSAVYELISEKNASNLFSKLR